jgi:hypothetical protein
MRELEQKIAFPSTNNDELLTYIDGIRKRWDELNEQGPTVPSKIWSRVSGGRGHFA